MYGAFSHKTRGGGGDSASKRDDLLTKEIFNTLISNDL